MTSDRLSAHGSKAANGDAKPQKAIEDQILGAARATKDVLKSVGVLAVRNVLVSWALFFNDAVLALQYSFKGELHELADQPLYTPCASVFSHHVHPV